MRSPLRILLALLACFISVPALACTCSASPFLELAEINADSLILQYRPVSHSDRDSVGLSFVEGEVIRRFKGEETTAVARIHGGDGLSCMPYAYHYELGVDWLLLVNRDGDGEFYLSPCQPRVRVEDDSVIGLITPLSCSGMPGAEQPCLALSREELAEASSERLSISEFEAALRLYSSAVAMALRACEGPWSRCNSVRPSYNPDTGELSLPGLDVITDPAEFGRYGIRATLQADDPDSPENFRVIDFGGPRGLLRLDNR